MPDRRRPGPAEPALGLPAEVVEGLGPGPRLVAREDAYGEGLGQDRPTMKNADCAVFVVPVLAMIGWPLLIAATVAVP